MLKRTIENFDKKNYQNNQTWVNLEDIAPVMVRAVIASEDGRFMEHWGFDLKEKKKTFVITQDGDTCVVNGMPKSVVKAGLSDETIPLPLIAQEIILHVGVK